MEVSSSTISPSPPSSTPFACYAPTFACLFSTLRASEESKTYEGYQVLRVNITSRSAFESIKSIFFAEEYDFWSEPSLFAPTDIMVPPQFLTTLKAHLGLVGIHYEVIYDNLQEAVNFEKYNYVAKEGSKMNWESYHPIDNIYGWMDAMAQQYPALVSVKTFGNSTEGRPMKVMKISTAGPDSQRPAVWIDGGIHAREWISPATVSYMANELILQATRRRQYKSLDSLDWYIVPSMNPDGYSYTMAMDRFWRKTRSMGNKQIFGGLGIFGWCKGTDANRNWDYEWGGKGTSKNQCSPIFHGEKAASEPEVSSAQAFILQIKDQIKLFLTFHSYSQLLLLPWAYDNKRPDDYDKLAAVGAKAVAALEAVYGTKYKMGSTAEILYAASGGSFDWAKAVAGVNYSYAFELRDTGSYGFLLPPNQIIPSGKETFAAVKSMAEDIMAINRIGSTPYGENQEQLFEISKRKPEGVLLNQI